MKLLFDQNLSFRLCEQLADCFPNSQHVRVLGMANADDLTLWRYAGANGYALVSFDADFADFATLYGPPPKVIWLRRGNQSTSAVAGLLRMHALLIASFENDDAACLEIY